jgi:hypothetical protein
MKDTKFDLYDQFTPLERATLLLNKYSFDYIRFLINGMIKQTRKNDEAVDCNYWNEVAIEIKKLKQ